jgi:hypothetical protein
MSLLIVFVVSVGTLDGGTAESIANERDGDFAE